MTEEFDLFKCRLHVTTAGVSLFMLAIEVNVSPPWIEAPEHRSGPGDVTSQLKSLKADLTRLEDGWAPSELDLAEAPLLARWGMYLHPGETLYRVVGEFHEAKGGGAWRIEEGCRIASMQALAFDGDFAWFRDRVGFYRLGDSA